jgi:Rhs element Vgr protein
MPKSPLASGNVVTYIINSDGSEIPDYFGVISIEIIKEINKINYAKIIFSDGDVTDGFFKLSNSSEMEPGKVIEIQLGYDNSNKSVFKGIIINQSIKVVNGVSFLEVECYDKAIQLTVIRNNDFFEKKKDSDIIKQVIGNHPGVTSTVAATTTKHEQLYQYQATDWDFILARAEANGLIILNDENKITVAKPKPVGSSALEVIYGTSLYDFDLKVSSYNQLKDVESSSWDISKQKVEKVKSKKAAEAKHGDLDAKKLSKVMGTKTYNLSSSVPLIKSELSSWADGFATRSALCKLSGSVSFTGNAAPNLNSVLKLSGLGKHFDGDGYISGVHHHIGEGNWKTTCILGLNSKYATQAYPDLNGLPTGGLLPAVSGLQIGIVTKVDADPEGQMRIKVKLPTWDNTKEIWARLSSFYASKQFGIFFLPEIEDEVIIGFFNDDPRFPVILGSMYNGKNKSPYTPEAGNNIKAIVTREKMKIEFDEEKKIITIETPAKNTIIIDDDAKSITLKDQNKNIVKMSADGISLDSAKDIKITAKGNINIEAKQKIVLKATADLVAEGMNIKQKAKTALTLEGLTAELKASTQATIKGAMVMIN